MTFFTGLHQPSDAKHIDNVFISVNRLQKRAAFTVKNWIMDSGAFSILLKYGRYPNSVKSYAQEIDRWVNNGTLHAAVTQDYMCEPAMLTKTGLTLREHQVLTIRRYDELMTFNPKCYIMPVLQGYSPIDYRNHLLMYGRRLIDKAWVGVGSVCKRNGNPQSIIDVLSAIKGDRPDLNLHGFGLKITSLAHRVIQKLLKSADSMAWSYAARLLGRNQNDWREAMKFKLRIEAGILQV